MSSLVFRKTEGGKAEIAQYLAALDGIQAKLGVCMGRKQAEREVDALRR
jgi:hypothetical protein